MAEEEKIEDNSIEEEKVDEEPESEPPANEEEEESAPIEYTKKLGVEDDEEEEESAFAQFIDNCIEYLDGRSRKVVLWTLGIFLLSTFNFIAWNFVESEFLKYTGVLLSTILLFSAMCGTLISYNVYNKIHEKNVDVRLSGLILSVGSVLVTLFFMIYQIQTNDCLTEFSEANCDADISLRAVITISVYAGSIGIVMLIYGLGLLERNLVPYAVAIAFGGSLILTIVLLMSVYSWIEESVWLLLIPLLFLGMGLAGLHHRRYQLAGFVIGCYITGLAGIGWLIEPNLASGGFLGGGLPMTGSGLLFILRRTDREAREKNYMAYKKFLSKNLWKPIESPDQNVVSNMGYPLIVENREKIQRVLTENGVESRPLVSGSMGTQPAWVDMYGESRMANADIIQSKGMYVPNHPEMTIEDVKKVCSIVNGIES